MKVSVLNTNKLVVTLKSHKRLPDVNEVHVNECSTVYLTLLAAVKHCGIVAERAPFQDCTFFNRVTHQQILIPSTSTDKLMPLPRI